MTESTGRKGGYLDANEELLLDTDTEQYLTFRLGQEIFAVDVFRVREVLDVADITRVPRSPRYMRGMINVRGNVVPVMDLRSKFGMEPVEVTLDTRIIVMESCADDEEGDPVVVGALADKVHEVTELEQDKVEAAPRIGMRWNSDYLQGVGKRGDDFIVILNIDEVFSADHSVAGAAGPKEE